LTCRISMLTGMYGFSSPQAPCLSWLAIG
jgi:hypothetical protein